MDFPWIPCPPRTGRRFSDRVRKVLGSAFVFSGGWPPLVYAARLYSRR